ncbi:McrC family protein [Deinococcus fonticola]|uniref:McrC family protein n=1 Tax=Deinococcus fonticola TaxID=2528713 RepID=UPI001074CFE5|nr:McrC family protein [Deinococcus fonticola]
MTYVVAREYDLIVRGPKPEGSGPGVHAFPPQAFDELRTFVQRPVAGKQGESEVLARPTLKGSQPALRLRQWVGVIRVSTGATLEILPKTHERSGNTDTETAIEQSRALLVRMLAAAGENYRTALPADLDPARMPLFEVVLRYALEILKTAIRRGIPHTYLNVEEERIGLRGRLNTPRQANQPPYRAHLLHVSYDEFLPDRPEPRLVRLALERIARHTLRSDNRRIARELLASLEGVPSSREVKKDFQAWELERGYAHFTPAKSVCKLILEELNPLTAGERSRATAVLFDMNVIFEEYIAELLRKQNPEWTVKTQEKGKSLGHRLNADGSKGKAAFPIRPDLLLEHPTRPLIVADTKWKRLSPDKLTTLGVSNADAYQMVAYSEIFQSTSQTREVWLVYPWVPDIPTGPLNFKVASGQTLRLVLVDLAQVTPTLNINWTAGNTLDGLNGHEQVQDLKPTM